MSKNTGLPQNKQSPSTENTETPDTSREGLFGSRTDVLLLGGGLFFLLVNLVVFFGINIRLNTLFFYLDIRHWSVFASVVVWTTAIWIVLEASRIVAFCLPLFRILAATCVLLAIIFALNSYSIASHSPNGYSLWFQALAACCIVRSLFLLYEYRYGEDDFDWEEAQWFWGMSGFLFVGLVVAGILCFIPVNTPLGDTFRTESLLEIYGDRFQELFQYGTGSFSLKLFILLIAGTTLAFVYATGRWILIIYLKVRGGVM